MKRIVVIPDMQIPSHDPKAVAAVQRFVKDYEPDMLLCVGDEADSPEPSQWAKGFAEEYGGTLQAGLDTTAKIMRQFKEAIGDKPFHTMRSNHGDRINKYINKYAPALSSLRALDYETLLSYKQNGITYHTEPYEFAPGFVLAHGDEGGLVQTAGGTALSLARKWGVSVVCGHTHKLGLQHDHDAFNGLTRRYIFGIEVGHLMQYGNGENGASYLRGGYGNWQQGFGIIAVKGTKVAPVPIPIINRTFVVEGKEYSWK